MLKQRITQGIRELWVIAAIVGIIISICLSDGIEALCMEAGEPTTPKHVRDTLEGVMPQIEAKRAELEAARVAARERVQEWNKMWDTLTTPERERVVKAIVTPEKYTEHLEYLKATNEPSGPMPLWYEDFIKEGERITEAKGLEGEAKAQKISELIEGRVRQLEHAGGKKLTEAERLGAERSILASIGE